MKKWIVLFAILFQIPPAHSQQKVRFSVDMGDPLEKGLFEPGKGDRVILRGDFCGWEGESFCLVQDGDGSIFSGDFLLPDDTASMIEYKFAVLTQDGQVFYETRANPEDLPYGNRKMALHDRVNEAPLAYYITNPYRLGMLGKEVLFSVEEMQSDFLQFRKTLEEKHCCLYEYTPKEAMDSLFGAQYRKIIRPMQPHEFFTILTGITSRIGCGHTGVWMPGDFWDMQPAKLFPLQIKLIGGEAVVTGCYEGHEQVPPGSILLEINGEPVRKIISFMQDHNSADALNRISTANVQLRFPMFYARWYGFPQTYRVKYALPGRKTFREATLCPASIESVRKVVFMHFNYPPLTINLLDDHVALMTIPSFIYYDRVPWFEHFLDSCFSLLKDRKISNLILDLRGNTGGDPWCAAPLFSYLEKEPSPYFAEAYHHYEKLAEPLPRAVNAFEGKVVLLMNGSCFSTCSHFCSLVKYHHLGTIVGTPSAGMYTCNGGGGDIRLVHSRIQLLYTGRSYAVAVENMDKTQPIIPDVLVEETYRDFLRGRDPCMEAAWKQLGK